MEIFSMVVIINKIKVTNNKMIIREEEKYQFLLLTFYWQEWKNKRKIQRSLIERIALI